MIKHSQRQLSLSLDMVCFNSTYPWKHFCIHRGTTSMSCYMCQCCDDYGSGIIIISMVLKLILKLLVILCICLLLIYPNLTIILSMTIQDQMLGNLKWRVYKWVSPASNSKTSPSYYDNYLNSQVLNNRENHYNTNTTKSILWEF